MKKTNRIYTVTATSRIRKTEFEATYMDYEYAYFVLKTLATCEDCLFCDMIDATTGEVLQGWEVDCGWSIYDTDLCIYGK